jgi:hypothetical protein
MMAGSSFNHWGKIAEALMPACGEVTKSVVSSIVTDYQARAPRDTGHMAESAYYVTSKESTFHADSRDFPEVQKPANETTAIAAVGARYGIFPELGTVHQAAQPAFYPAVEAGRKNLDAGMGTIAQKMEEAAR